MAHRRVLVIGSQCAALGRLSFLPQVAQSLYGVMTSPELGQCEPASDVGLLIDPPAEKLYSVLKQSVEAAASDAAALFLFLVGHGVYHKNEFYFMTADGQMPPDTRTAFNVVHVIKEVWRDGLNGIAVVIDACNSGGAVHGAGAKLIGEQPANPHRLEILTATSATAIAADGCFTKALVQVLKDGLQDDLYRSRIDLQNMQRAIKKICKKQESHFLLWSQDSDEGLWLGWNIAIKRKFPNEMEKYTQYLVPTPVLSKVIQESMKNRSLAITSVIGQGKTTLAASLLRPREGVVPVDFVQAIVFSHSITSIADMAEALTEQLEANVPGFKEAQRQFEALSTAGFQQLDSLRREVFGPLQHLSGQAPIRLVLDGLDQLPERTWAILSSSLTDLVTNPKFDHVRLVLTARAGLALPGKPMRLSKATRDEFERYFELRHVPRHFWNAIVAKADGNWLVARLLVDRASEPQCDISQLTADLGSVYRDELRVKFSHNLDRWRSTVRPVLTILAVAGAGPVLPLQILRLASTILRGPTLESEVIDALVFDLGGWVLRDRPGTNDERVGLFHPSLVEFLTSLSADDEFSLSSNDGHLATAQAIAELAPAEAHRPEVALHVYASVAEAEHLWAMEEYDNTLRVLQLREGTVVADNLAKWKDWLARFKNKFGAANQYTFTAREKIAYWTRQSGRPHDALSLYMTLLQETMRRGRRHDRNTLALRNNIASSIGKIGRVHQALRLFKQVLKDQERTFGTTDRDTLRTRHNLAHWTGQAGKIKGALKLFNKLLPSMEKSPYATYRDISLVRSEIARLKGELGDTQGALEGFNQLLREQNNSPYTSPIDTLRTRNSIAQFTGRSGKWDEAYQLYANLVPELTHVFGPDNPETLQARHDVAYCLGNLGHHQDAIRLLWQVYEAQSQELGPNHIDTLSTLHNIALFNTQLNDNEEALRLFADVYTCQRRLLGSRHADTVRTLRHIEILAFRSAFSQSALRILQARQSEQADKLGQAHSDTRITAELISKLSKHMTPPGMKITRSKRKRTVS